MSALQTYTIPEIRERLLENCLPFSGITVLGSSEFRFLEPCHYAGIVLHAGSRIRPSILNKLNISPAERFREEDPYMEAFIREFPFQVIARDSRFEYDLNREPEGSVYPHDKPKYGLNVWKTELPVEEIGESVRKHEEFYQLMDLVVNYLLKRNRFALIFDMHSYCYQRERKREWFEEPSPEINLGTGAVNREVFGGLIELCIRELGGLKIDGRAVRVAENEIFRGGYLSRRLSRKWNRRVLVLALEYKKIFMDEWSGEVYPETLDVLTGRFLAAVDTIAGEKLSPS